MTGPIEGYEGLRTKLMISIEGRPSQWRAGQAAFNALGVFRPDLAEKMRGGDGDPFHDDARLPAFWARLRDELATEADENRETEEQRIERLANEMVDIVEQWWDEDGLSTEERETRVAAFSTAIERIKRRNSA